ncbi:dihydrodipicolinate synthase family protein [Actinopolymorpha sp. B11F2]|uniref:dihydrodipicolinate synthase family protein n=1 Tax=Actinopolymorpha sp. B11F2 TaxID=3160862 RepID=UPI0032E3F46D
MTRLDHLKGVFGLLPTPYTEDYEIHTADLLAAADFCCETGQHGIVWPVMVGEFYLLGESERLRHLEPLLEKANGRLPVVFGCSGTSIPQVLLFAREAQKAGADAIIAMPPARTTQDVGMDMFRRLGEVFEGPIILQNASDYVPLSAEQVASVVDDVPQIEYVKEERPPGPRHIGEIHQLLGDKIKTIFGGVGGRLLPEELVRGAGGCMPACQVADVLAKVMEQWWAGDEPAARDLHQRLLPILIRERQSLMRYILRRRGVFTSTVQRAPSAALELDTDDKREISILIEAIRNDVGGYPFGAE